MADRTVFEALVGDHPDMVGTLAYALYKRDKRDYIKRCISAHGRPPSAEELEAFASHCLLNGSLDGFKERARAISSAWISRAIRRKSKHVAARTRHSTLTRQLEAAVQRKLDERRTWAGWLREAGTALLTNALALVLVGLLGFGVKLYDVFNSKVERIVEIPASAERR